MPSGATSIPIGTGLSPSNWKSRPSASFASTPSSIVRATSADSASITEIVPERAFETSTHRPSGVTSARIGNEPTST
ncbi:MAG TPA: hypothetical protein VMR44_09755, partial [Thermoanaerobaculia bacterium]|nr:hypothetical protein [Thermoanaerobaculia bacterium]